ncbi:1-acyl-sn-glycerol-3-phosphate acyltransferase [Zoogloea sp. 1C4]|uniref:lysophospholipid acyltransferase family protein n=1 Tax=Zoogloea sp. 1C4 TaxID=2570190 RepID=UPI001D1753F1|nr:lysophospholipid acyltransferase family protein [Zoogloea sp. 1C4]
MAIAAAAFPFLGLLRRRQLKQWWSARLVKVLGVTLQIRGGGDVVPGCLLVANHVSWLDIFIINAAWPAAFISKAEVRQWPLFGWLAVKSETVFLHRGSRGHAKVVNGEIAGLLADGQYVALFPEGTTTDGSTLHNFHGALLQPAIDAGALIQPLAIAYRLPDGRFTRAPAYDGDVSLGECLRAIVGERHIVARIDVEPALCTRETPDRKALAHMARAAILERIESA